MIELRKTIPLEIEKVLLNDVDQEPGEREKESDAFFSSIVRIKKETKKESSALLFKSEVFELVNGMIAKLSSALPRLVHFFAMIFI